METRDIMNNQETFSININRGFERWTKNTFIFTNETTHPSKARSSLKKP